jgi:hypothetical protein
MASAACLGRPLSITADGQGFVGQLALLSPQSIVLIASLRDLFNIRRRDAQLSQSPEVHLNGDAMVNAGNMVRPGGHQMAYKYPREGLSLQDTYWR